MALNVLQKKGRSQPKLSPPPPLALHLLVNCATKSIVPIRRSPHWSLSSGSTARVATASKNCSGIKTGQHGSNIQIQDNVISGQGWALADNAIEQDRAYFEVHLTERSIVFVGVAASMGADAHVGEAQGSYGVCIRGNEGDVIAVKFDQSDFPVIATIHHLNKVYNLTNVRGEMWPACSVEAGSFRWEFDNCTRKGELDPTDRFPLLMKSRNILG